MNNERQSPGRPEEHAGGPQREAGAAKASGDRRAEHRVADDQHIGEGAQTAWSRMAMLERRKRLWADIRRAEHEEEPEAGD